jgi:hypothetical protein
LLYYARESCFLSKLLLGAILTYPFCALLRLIDECPGVDDRP